MNLLTTVRDAKLEPSLVNAGPGQNFQFEHPGYFFTDPVDSKPDTPVFSRTATLSDTWTKETARDNAPISRSSPQVLIQRADSQPFLRRFGEWAIRYLENHGSLFSY